MNENAFGIPNQWKEYVENTSGGAGGSQLRAMRLAARGHPNLAFRHSTPAVSDDFSAHEDPSELYESRFRLWTEGMHPERSRHESVRGHSSVFLGEITSRPALAPPALLPSIERIAEMAHLPSDWDSCGAVPPAALAVAEAFRLIVACAERTTGDIGAVVAPWTSAPIADGGLQVEWLGNKARIEVQVAPDGSFGYLAKWSEGDEAHYTEGEDVSLNDMVDLIARIVSS